MQPNDWRTTMRSTLTALGIGVWILMVPANLLANDGPMQDPEKAYAKAVFVESVDGDLAAAIELYQRITESSATPSDVEYRARVRWIHCLRRLGRIEEATAGEKLLAKRFPDRATLTSRTQDGPSGVDGQTAHLIQQLGDASSEVRTQARTELIWFGDLVVPQLEEAIRGGNVFRSVGSASVLVRLSQNSELAARALARSLRDESTVIRRNTLRGIEEIKIRLEPIVSEALIARVLEDSDAKIRKTAASVLRRGAPEVFYEHLLELYEVADAPLRGWLLGSSGGSADELQALVQRALADPSSVVRENAMVPAMVLERAHGIVDVALETARRLIEDDESEVRAAALRVVDTGMIDRHPEVVDEVVALLVSRVEDPSVAVRHVALDRIETLARTDLDPNQRGRLYASLSGLRAFREMEQDTLRRLQSCPSHPAIVPWILACLEDRYLYLDALDYVRSQWRADYANPVVAVLEGFDDDPVVSQDSRQFRAGRGRAGASDLTRVVGHYGAPEQLETIFAFRDRRAGIETEAGFVEDLDKAARTIVERYKETLSAAHWNLVIERIGDEQRKPLLKQLAKTRRLELVPAYADWLQATSDSSFLDPLFAFADQPEVTLILLDVAKNPERPTPLRIACASKLLELESSRDRAIPVAAEIIRGGDGDSFDVQGLVADLTRAGAGIARLRELCEHDSRFTTSVLFDGSNVIDRRVIEIGLRSEFERVREYTLGFLEKYGDETWLEHVVRLTADESAPVRRSAAMTLGSFRATDAIPVLVEMLRDNASDVRESAKVALDRIRFYAEQKAWWDEWKATGGAKNGISAILSLLDHENPEVRLRAIRSLGSIGSPEALPRLLQILESGDEAARSAAADAIDRINEASR